MVALEMADLDSDDVPDGDPESYLRDLQRVADSVALGIDPELTEPDED